MITLTREQVEHNGTFCPPDELEALFKDRDSVSLLDILRCESVSAEHRIHVVTKPNVLPMATLVKWVQLVVERASSVSDVAFYVAGMERFITTGVDDDPAYLVSKYRGRLAYVTRIAATKAGDEDSGNTVEKTITAEMEAQVGDLISVL